MVFAHIFHSIAPFFEACSTKQESISARSANKKNRQRIVERAGPQKAKSGKSFFACTALRISQTS
jgi:hypothetical protein